MQKFGNVSSVPLSLAVFLATDNYDHDESVISATALLKPLRQIILSSRVPAGTQLPDLGSMMASRMGSAIHDAIERAWLNNHANALDAIGIPQRMIERVLINPTKDQLYDGCIPVYLEQRAYKQVGKWRIAGKFDFVAEGIPEDFKSASVYSAINQSNDEKFTWQLSIYRWLNPDIITSDTGKIQFIFTDWSSAQAKQDPNYPQQRYLQRVVNLKSVHETENFIRRKLELIEKYWDAPEDQIPHCTDEELWRSEPVYKYYADPDKAKAGGRSTKNFDSEVEANTHRAMKGVGVVITKPGQVQACRYCAAASICTQKDGFIASGELVINLT